MKFKNSFNANLPYKVIAVSLENEVKYKITQPLSLWIFGLTNKYYNVTQWYLREKYSSVLYFKNKKEVDAFVLEEKEKQYKSSILSEIIVFDSLQE